jgi:hypothetical protein
MVYAVNSQVASATKLVSTDASEPLTLHSWYVEVDDADPDKFRLDEVLIPDTRGLCTSGISAPFPTWATIVSLYREVNGDLHPAPSHV